MEILANALEGKTVLDPSPVYPPQMPLTSKVGRIPVRSRVLYPSSPCRASMPKSFMYSAASLNQGTVYTIEIVGNNKSSGTIDYSYNGIAQSVAVQKFDLYVNGTLIGNDLDDGNITTGVNVNSVMFVGASSGSNVANIFVDDIVIYNAVPASIGAAPTSPTLFAQTLSQLSTITGTASTGVSFTASGSNLTGNITVTPQSGYEISTTSSTTGFSSSAASVANNTQVFVRFASSIAAGTYNGATAAILTSTGATAVNVTTSASGNVVFDAQPTTQASSVTAGTPTGTTLPSLTCTVGNGARRAIFIAQTTSGNAAPVDGTAYTANAAFGTGSQIGSTGWYCVFDGTGSPSVTVTGLSTSLSYRVMAVEYNGSGATANYLTTTATAIRPTSPPTIRPSWRQGILL